MPDHNDPHGQPTAAPEPPAAPGDVHRTPRPVRVLHLINSLQAGGAERMLSHIVLPGDGEAQGDEQDTGAALCHTVVTLKSGGKYEAILRDQGIEVITLALGGVRTLPAALWCLVGLIRDMRPDCLKCWMYHANIIGTVALYLSGRRRRTGLYWGIRCSDMDLSGYGAGLRLAVRLNRLVSRSADAIIYNSHAGLYFHSRSGFWHYNAIVIDNGVDVARFRNPPADARAAMRARYGIGKRAFVVGTIARNDPMKGYPLLQKLLASHRRYTGFAAGLGTDALDSGDGRFIGAGAVADVAGILPGFDIFVLASDSEGQSNALMEAMAAGCAVIATDVGDSARLVGEAGVVVPPGDMATLGTAINRLYADEGKRRRLGEAATLRMESRYSLTRAKTRFETLFREGVGALFMEDSLEALKIERSRYLD